MQILAERRLNERTLLTILVEEGHSLAEIGHLDLDRATRRIALNLTLIIASEVGAGAIRSPRLILALALVGVPHTREDVLMLIREGVSVEHLLRGIFAVRADVVDLLGRYVEDRSRVICSEQQRTCAILIAVQHRQQGVGVVGVVAIHRGVGHRTDCHRGIRAVTEHNDRHGQRNGIEQHLASLVRKPHRCTQRRKQRKDEEDHTRIDRQTQRIDKQTINHRTYCNRIRDNYTIDCQQNSACHEGRNDHTSQRNCRPLAEVVDEHQRRDCQQVQDMHTD